MTRLLVTVSLLAPLIAGEGCDSADRGPTEPTVPSGPSYAYTISGTVSQFRGGPLSGVNVRAYTYRESSGTVTDPQGHYSLSSPFAGDVSLDVWKTGYMSAWKSSLPTPESTVDFVLHPSVELSAVSDTFAGTIRGDEHMGGDDVLFGGFCSRGPCKVLGIKYSGSPPRVEMRLRWDNPTRQLALYVTHADLETIPPPVIPPSRFGLDCCSTDDSVTATFSVPYMPYVAVAFEQAGGAPPRPGDSQSFELTIRSIR